MARHAVAVKCHQYSTLGGCPAYILVAHIMAYWLVDYAHVYYNRMEYTCPPKVARWQHCNCSRFCHYCSRNINGKAQNENATTTQHSSTIMDHRLLAPLS
jgi:hypothetical protein